MIKDRLMEKFGKIINHYSCVYLNDGETVLRSFLKQGMNTIIELGTYQGVSTAVLAEYAKKVYTFDVIDMELRQQIWDYLEIKNIEFKLIKQRAKRKAFIDTLIKKEKIDLVFIDAQHDGGEPERDYEMMKKCNVLLFHDYAPPWKEIYELINNMKGWQKTFKPSFALLTKKKLKSTRK